MAPEPSAYVASELSERLVGFRLYSVQFVMDYVQLRFDGPTSDMPVLTCDVMPTVELPGSALTPGVAGYADALTAFIPNAVVSTTAETGQGLRIEFAQGTIVLNPTADDLTGPEIALLDGFQDGRWMCWRPGEECFENLAQPGPSSGESR